MRYDFHTHTVFSDGELIPSELVRRAKVLNHKAIAITDHGDASNYKELIEKTILAKEELKELEPKIPKLEEEIKLLLLPKDPNDDKNIYLEIRAGTGGDEAALFVGDLLKAYLRYADNKGWRVEIVSESKNDIGGYKEIIFIPVRSFFQIEIYNGSLKIG